MISEIFSYGCPPCPPETLCNTFCVGPSLALVAILLAAAITVRLWLGPEEEADR